MRGRSRSLRAIARAAGGILGLAACDAGPAGDASASAGGAPAGWESVGEREESLRLYYQYVDARGGVRFVERLEQVPASWRDRVGFVKLDAPPPLAPDDAERQRSARALREPAPDSEASATLVLYSADWCPICARAKDHLDDLGIEYEERDVDEPEWRQELVAKTGRRAIPVFEYEGRILSGFRPEALERLIGRRTP